MTGQIILAGPAAGPLGFLPIALLAVIALSSAIGWAIIVRRRRSSQHVQSDWIAKKFDGKEVVEIYAPTTALPNEQLARIAYRHGYIFARSYIAGRDFNHTYVFRKVFMVQPPPLTPSQLGPAGNHGC